MVNNKKLTAKRRGLTLIELILASSIGLIIILVLGSVHAAANKMWLNTFNSEQRGIRPDAIDITVTFGNIGRKSNRSDYVVYEQNGNDFTKVVPDEPEEVVTGHAVEFRYWDQELNASLMDINKTATAYAFFYRDGTDLKVDYGAYPSGAINSSDNRNTPDRTHVLAKNVTKLEFSHTTKSLNGDGKGSVRIEAQLTDPDTNEVITVKTTTLLRNVWGL